MSIHVLLPLLWLAACSSGGDIPSGDTGHTDTAEDTDLTGDTDDTDDTDDCVPVDEVPADGIDQDCDGLDLCYGDLDGDSFGSSDTVAAPSCDAAGVADNLDDCDDTDGSVFPGAVEAMGDSIDQDCDAAEVCHTDADADGFGTAEPVASADTDCLDEGEAGNAGDCLDAGAGAAETWPGAAPSDSEAGCLTDADGDGYGSDLPADGVTAGTDCDDADPSLHECGPGETIYVGNNEEFEDSSNHAANYLLGSLLTVPDTMTITDLALIGKEASANVKMAIYSDSGGAPASLVLLTDSTPVPVGVLEMPVEPTVLPAGDYWIMAVFDRDASVGIDTSDKSVAVKYRSHTYAAALPDHFGTASEYEGQIFNFYIVGY